MTKAEIKTLFKTLSLEDQQETLMELNMMKSEILRRVNEGREVPVEKLVFVMSPDG